MTATRAARSIPQPFTWDDLPLICGVTDIQALYGCGEATAYALLNGWLAENRAQRVGARIVISQPQLRRIVEGDTP